MITRTFLILLLFTTIASCNKKPAIEKPNIILIMADDMGYECLSTYGSTSYKTPRLDQMAENGMRFDHCISNPLCTPSRVKIMTGKYNYRNYEYFGYLNPKEYTFGNLMQEAGYATCIVGKWQLNGIYHDLPGNQDLDRPFEFGFDEYCLWQVHKGKGKGERFANPLIVQNGTELDRDPNAYGPQIFADYALDFIERKRDSNFFIYYPMVLVHDPFVPTPDSEEWSDPERRYEDDTTYFKDMVAYTDKIVGQIIDKLEALDIADNTLLIFTGDNGTHRSIISRMDDGTIRGAKGNTIDAGVHVPLVMQWPGRLEPGQTYDKVIEFTDFFASLSQIANVQKPTDGISFLPLLKGEAYDGREYAFVHYDPMWGKWVNQYRNQFVQDKRYKLYQDGKLFDTWEDADELEPLIEGSSESDKATPLPMDVSKRQNEMQAILDTVPEFNPNPE